MVPCSMGAPPLPSMILTFVTAIGFALDHAAANPSSAPQMHRPIPVAVRFRIDHRSLCMTRLFDAGLDRSPMIATDRGRHERGFSVSVGSHYSYVDLHYRRCRSLDASGIRRPIPGGHAAR